MIFAETHQPISMVGYMKSIENEDATMGELVSVSGGDLLDVLKNQRDPWLWYAVIQGLNYDIEDSFEVAAWVLEQPDCDALIAISTFGFLEGPYWCEQALKNLRASGDQRPPMLTCPKELLMAPLTGTLPNPQYMVDETGLWMDPIQKH